MHASLPPVKRRAPIAGGGMFSKRNASSVIVGLCGAVIVILFVVGVSMIIDVRHANQMAQQRGGGRHDHRIPGEDDAAQHQKMVDALAKLKSRNMANKKAVDKAAAGGGGGSNNDDDASSSSSNAGSSSSLAEYKQSIKSILTQIDRVSRKITRIEGLLSTAVEEEKATLEAFLKAQRQQLRDTYGLDFKDVAAVLDEKRRAQHRHDGAADGNSGGAAADEDNNNILADEMLALLQKGVVVGGGSGDENNGANGGGMNNNAGGAGAGADGVVAKLNEFDDALNKLVSLGLQKRHFDGQQQQQHQQKSPALLDASPFSPLDEGVNDSPSRHRRFREERLPKIRQAVNEWYPLKRYGIVGSNYSGDHLDFGRVHRPEDGDYDLSNDIAVVGGGAADRSQLFAGSLARAYDGKTHDLKLSDSKVRTGKIFVSLASFRDTECSRTVLDMFSKAKHPQRIYVGAAEQHTPGTDGSCIPQEFLTQACQLGRTFCPTDNIRVRQIDPMEAKGPVYGRYMAQLLYRGEDYYFMLDSHTRFSTHWDTKIIEMYENLRNSDHYRTEVVYSGEEPTIGLATDPVTGGELKDFKRAKALRTAASEEERALLAKFDLTDANIVRPDDSSSVVDQGITANIDPKNDRIAAMEKYRKEVLSGRGGLGDLPNRYDYDLQGRGLVGGAEAKDTHRQTLIEREAELYTERARPSASSTGGASSNGGDGGGSAAALPKKPRKIVFSHYPEAFNEPKPGDRPFDVDNRPNTAYLCRGHIMPNLGFFRLDAILTSKRSIPLPQPFAAAGFLFADASLLQEVPFDPYLDFVFDGEEILYSARMWTAGWDMFSPNENIVFHMYGRANAPKYWSHGDRSPKSAVRKAHAEKRVQYLLRAISKQAVEEAMAKAIPPSATAITADGITATQKRVIEEYSTTDGNAAAGNGLKPYLSSPLSANSLLMVDDGMLTTGRRQDVRDPLADNHPRGGNGHNDVPIDEATALPWYVTAEEDVYGMGTERSLEAFYEFAGINPFTYEFTKNWCEAFA